MIKDNVIIKLTPLKLQLDRIEDKLNCTLPFTTRSGFCQPVLLDTFGEGKRGRGGCVWDVMSDHSDGRCDRVTGTKRPEIKGVNNCATAESLNLCHYLLPFNNIIPIRSKITWSPISTSESSSDSCPGRDVEFRIPRLNAIVQPCSHSSLASVIRCRDAVNRPHLRSI